MFSLATFLLLLVFGALPSVFDPARAYADEAPSDSARVIRVAYVQQEPMSPADESGAFVGYTYEYFERLAQYTGWSYEFVPVEGSGPAAYKTLRDLLGAGDADVAVGLMATQEGRESLAFTRDSFAALNVVLRTAAEVSDDPLDEATSDHPLRVAVIEGSPLASDLEAFCAQNEIPYETVGFADAGEARDAVLNGRVDVELAADMSDTTGLRTVVHMTTHPLYFAVALDNRALAGELDDALDRIDQVDPLFRARLRDRHFSVASPVFLLTDVEKSFVEGAAPVRVGVLSDQPPYQYQEDGQVKGIAVDILETVAQKTGLRFEYVAAETAEALDALQAAGSIDMVAGIDRDYSTANERNLALTQPYVSASYVLVANKSVADGAISGKRLAISSSSSYDGGFLGDAIQFPSIASCLRAVFKGEADYTYVDEYMTQYFLNTPEFRDVRIAPQTYEPRRVSLGVVRSDDTTLLGIVDRAVGSLTEVERQAVINGNVLRERPVDLGELVHANPAIALAVASATCLIVVLFVLIILGLRARSNAKTAFDLKKRLRLYALCDDSFFEFDCRTKRLIISMPGKGQQGLSEPFAFECDAPAVFDEERKRSFAELLGGKEHRVEEVRMPDTDGIEHWLRVTVDPVEDASGRVAHTVGKIEVIDEERREKDQLVARAERDSLTGLLNSETTRLRIGQQLDALAGGERGALLVVDVDCFKDVNDTHGHLVGDLVLADIARILRENFRIGDVVGRLGGDEFMVYLDRVGSTDVVLGKCDRLRRAVERHEYPGTDCRVTISVGVVLAHAGDTFDDLYGRADEALYAAKRDGRNRCGLADGALRSPKAAPAP